MSRAQRDKGARIEREVVNRHLAIGVAAKRVPLSGAMSAYTGGHDVDLYPFGKNSGAIVCEVKSGKQIPTTITKWLGENDALFLRPDRADPMVVLPWRVWERLCRALQ